MPKQHKVVEGDCIDSLAAEYGRTADALWNAPDNAELRRQRKHPNLLAPGDVVVIPDPKGKIVSCATGQRHVFRRRESPLELRVRVFDEDFEPRVEARWTVELDDGSKHEGTIDAKGFVVCPLTPEVRKATLVVHQDGPPHEDDLEPAPWEDDDETGDERWEIDLGHLQPLDPAEAESNTGLRNRLANLALLDVEPEEATDEDVRAAVAFVQEREGVPATGVPDARTMSVLHRLGDG